VRRARSDDGRKPPFGVIAQALRDGRAIPFLGAGASMCSAAWKKGAPNALPSVRDLIAHLVDMASFPDDAEQQLTTVAQYYKVVSGRAELTRELHAIFDADPPIGRIHEYLAELPGPLLIMTTNYDDLIERALRAKEKPFDLVVHPTERDVGEQVLWWRAESDPDAAPQAVNPNKLFVDLETTTVVYKMHGTVHRSKSPRDQYVITEDDYVDFLTRMTNSKAIPKIFAEPMQRQPFLFLGYGLRDWNLRVVLNSFTHTKDVKSWAIDIDPSTLETRFWQDREVEVFRMSLDDFADGLQAIP
jgi:hypothetical protein